jgi:4-hydroxy-3-polyprenylbenzoate decarboxylase
VGLRFPGGFTRPKVVLPGVLVVQGTPPAADFAAAFRPDDPIGSFPLVVLVDDSDFTSQSLRNWLWVTFTRSNPAADIEGIGSFVDRKHWGCRGPLVIDARIKPHHAPPLVDDPEVERRVDALAAPGGPLHGVL